MDATRPRRTRDQARQRWYGKCRTRRFARLLQFCPASEIKDQKKGPANR